MDGYVGRWSRSYQLCTIVYGLGVDVPFLERICRGLGEVWAGVRIACFNGPWEGVAHERWNGVWCLIVGVE